MATEDTKTTAAGGSQFVRGVRPVSEAHHMGAEEQAAIKRSLLKGTKALDAANAAMRDAAQKGAGAFEQLDAGIAAMQNNELERLHAIVACARYCSATGVGGCVEIDSHDSPQHGPCTPENCKFMRGERPNNEAERPTRAAAKGEHDH